MCRELLSFYVDWSKQNRSRLKCCLGFGCEWLAKKSLKFSCLRLCLQIRHFTLCCMADHLWRPKAPHLFSLFQGVALHDLGLCDTSRGCNSWRNPALCNHLLVARPWCIRLIAHGRFKEQSLPWVCLILTKVFRFLAQMEFKANCTSAYHRAQTVRNCFFWLIIFKHIVTPSWLGYNRSVPWWMPISKVDWLQWCSSSIGRWCTQVTCGLKASGSFFTVSDVLEIGSTASPIGTASQHFILCIVSHPIPHTVWYRPKCQFHVSTSPTGLAFTCSCFLPSKDMVAYSGWNVQARTVSICSWGRVQWV